MNQCELIKVCDLTWEDLIPTHDPTCQYCNTCAQQVFLSHTKADFELLSSLRHCIALAENHEFSQDFGKMGEPKTLYWMNKADFAVYLTVPSPISATQKTHIQQMLGKCIDANTLALILSGERVYLFDLDTAPAWVLVEKMKPFHIQVELTPNATNKPTF